MLYGLGMSVVGIGERRMIRHGGAFPGQVTRTLIDPYDGLAVVVLVNEIGGPADLLACSVARIIDVALRQPPRSGERAPGSGACVTGRFVDLWGVADVTVFGETMPVLNPNDDDPTAVWLEPLDGDTLRLTKTNGYGAPGETLRAVRDEAGRVAKIFMAGSSMYLPESYRARQGPVAYD